MVDVLPEKPHTFGDDAGGFRQRWLPGAFGERQTLAGVDRFRVTRDEWLEDDDGNVRRTIFEAEVLDGR